MTVEKGKENPREGKRKTPDLLTKAVSLWAAACAAAPVFACGAQIIRAHSPLKWMALPCIAFFMSVAALIVPARKARPAAVCAVLAAGILTFAVQGGGLAGTVSGTACAALCFVCLSRRSSPPGREWGYFFWTAGLIVQLLLWSMFANGIIFDHPDYPRAAVFCGLGTCVFFLLFLLFLNRMTLIGASHADITARKVPFAIRFRNTGAVVFLFAIAVAAGFSQRIRSAAAAVWNGILYAVGAVVRFVLSLVAYTPPEGSMRTEDGGGGGLLPVETVERSLFAEILEKIFLGLAFLLAIFLLILALRTLWKTAIKLAGLIRLKIMGMMDRASEDYTETVDDTRRGKQKEKARRRGFAAPREVRPGNGTDLVRYLYRKFLKKHPERKGLTCREALKDSPERESFAGLYERARYSGQPVDMKDSEALERRLKQKT